LTPAAAFAPQRKPSACYNCSTALRYATLFRRDRAPPFPLPPRQLLHRCGYQFSPIVPFLFPLIESIFRLVSLISSLAARQLSSPFLPEARPVSSPSPRVFFVAHAPPDLELVPFGPPWFFPHVVFCFFLLCCVFFFLVFVGVLCWFVVGGVVGGGGFVGPPLSSPGVWCVWWVVFCFFFVPPLGFPGGTTYALMHVISPNFLAALIAWLSIEPQDPPLSPSSRYNNPPVSLRRGLVPPPFLRKPLFNNPFDLLVVQRRSVFRVEILSYRGDLFQIATCPLQWLPCCSPHLCGVPSPWCRTSPLLPFSPKL